VDDCLAVADFGDVVILSDQFNELRTPGAQHIRVENWKDKIGYCRALWYQVPLFIKTEFMMMIQWDSWIVHPNFWKPEFLSYDYIGAPWTYHDDINVGNSGFSIRSKRLMDIIKDRDEFPLNDSAEDFMICRSGYRNILAERGITWAPEKLAYDFSIETSCPEGFNKSFGFHGIFLWPYFLEKDRLIERAKLAAKSRYINNTMYFDGNRMLDEMISRAPWLTFFIGERKW